MATDSQIAMVCDIEAAVSALTDGGKKKPPVGLTISEIMEMSERTIHDLRPAVMRLLSQGDIDLLKRLKDAFERVGLKQKTLTKHLEKLTDPNAGAAEVDLDAPETEPQPEDFKLEQVMPSEKPRLQVVNSPGEHPKTAGDTQALVKVLETLRPLSAHERKRVINSAAVFLGVGE